MNTLSCCFLFALCLGVLIENGGCFISPRNLVQPQFSKESGRRGSDLTLNRNFHPTNDHLGSSHRSDTLWSMSKIEDKGENDKGKNQTSVMRGEKLPTAYIVPSNDSRFSVPTQGMKLGDLVDSIRNQNTYKQYKEQLLALGFDYSCQVREFSEVREGLLAYKAIYGNLLVPFEYEISHNDSRYSEGLWGMKLGLVVNSIRSCGTYKSEQAELLAMGFDYDKQVGDFEVLLEALLVYKRNYGNVNSMQSSFTIPKDDDRFSDKAKKLHANLGSRVYSIRHMDGYTQYRKELENIGIEYTFEPIYFQKFKAALEIYKQDHGDCYVPKRFDTRNDGRYPKELRGSNKMYKYVNCIRCGLIYDNEQYRSALLAMGFDYHKKEGDFELVKQALLAYKKIHGDLLVDQEYKIPPNDTRYPPQMRGRALGSIVDRIRCAKQYKRHKKELLVMGFDYDQQKGDFELVREALLAYKKVHGTLLVPHLFIIPIDSADYPTAVRGMKLGNVVGSIRYHGHYKKHREELIAMGFEFKVRQKTEAELSIV